MIYNKHYTTVMTNLLPEGKRGNFTITKKLIKKGMIMRTYSPAGFFYYDRFRSNFPVVTLMEGESTMWMSDTPMEQEGLRIPTVVAHGDVLILGLGIGLYPVLLKTYNKTIRRVVIVEKELAVVQLVYPHIRSSKTEVLVCDAEKYLLACTDKFDFIYVDVWGSINAPLTEADKWTKLAQRCLTEGGEVRCWLHELHERIRGNLARGPAFKTGEAGLHPPCLTCGKMFRNDYAGLCMDCADLLSVSEMYIKGGPHGIPDP